MAKFLIMTLFSVDSNKTGNVGGVEQEQNIHVAVKWVLGREKGGGGKKKGRGGGGSFSGGKRTQT